MTSLKIFNFLGSFLGFPYMLHYNHLLTHVYVSGKLQRTPHNGSLSRAGSVSSLNLDTWDIMEAEAGDEKDKRIRELEETLRKQKELMEILQRKLNDTPSSVRCRSL